MGNRRASQPPEDRLVLPRGHDVDVRTVIVPTRLDSGDHLLLSASVLASR